MMKSKSWSFLLPVDTVSFRKSQIYAARHPCAEPTYPFLHIPQSDVHSEKRKAALWNSRSLPIPKERYWSVIAAGVQVIQARRKSWLRALLLEQPSLSNGECLTC